MTRSLIALVLILTGCTQAGRSTIPTTLSASSKAIVTAVPSPSASPTADNMTVEEVQPTLFLVHSPSCGFVHVNYTAKTVLTPSKPAVGDLITIMGTGSCSTAFTASAITIIVPPTATPSPTPTPTPTPTPRALEVGVWANQNGSTEGHAQEEADTESIEAQIGHRFAIHNYYAGWDALNAGSLNDPLIAGDKTFGRKTFVAWKSPGDLATILTGADDQGILDMIAFAKAYQGPVLIRWFYEFNLNMTCYAGPCTNGNPVSFSSEDTTSQKAAKYVAAYEYIIKKFRAAGTSNVTFVWCPALNANNVDTIDASWIPPDVDIIGNDVYDKTLQGYSSPLGFVNMVHPWYDKFAVLNKPMMLAETGEVDSLQKKFFQDILNVLEAGSFPQLEAIVYFSADPNGWDWRLGSGLPALQTLMSSTVP